MTENDTKTGQDIFLLHMSKFTIVNHFYTPRSSLHYLRICWQDKWNKK